MKTWQLIVGSICVLLVIGMASYGAYRLNRWVNWNVGGYKDDARSVVESMVKEECLK